MRGLADTITRFADMLRIGPLRRIPRQVFRYAVCGSGNLVLSWILYFLIYHLAVRGRYLNLGVVTVSPHVLSLAVSFPITFLTGYWLQSRVSFRGSPLSAQVRVSRYAVSVAGSLLLNYICLKVLVEAVGLYPTPSQILSSLITVVYSFLVQKYYTFRGAES